MINNCCKDMVSISIQNDGIDPKTFRLFGGGTGLQSVDDNDDPAFTYGMAFDSGAFDVAIDSSGRLIVVGDFTTYNTVNANRIVRINTDGSIDSSFVYGTGFSTGTRSIAIQSDGKILIGGNFSSYDGNTANKIIRLNTDGSVDSSFITGTGFSGSTVETIKIQSDGKIVVAGGFLSYNGTGAVGIIRLNTDGSIDSSFVYGTGFSGVSDRLALQSDGKILVGGNFSSYNGNFLNKIIRLDSNGSVDSSFSIGTGFDFRVWAIALQSDGKILVGGDFNNYDGTGANRIIRLNSGGSIDSSFVYGTGFSFGTRSITVQSDGKIIIGGGYTSYQGTTANRIIRLNSNASIDTSFIYGTGFNTSTVNDILIQPDLRIVTVGGFTAYQTSIAANRILRLNTDGSINNTDSTFVTITVNGGQITLDDLNANTGYDPMCVCEMKVDTINLNAYAQNLLQKIRSTSTGTILIDDVNLIAKHTAMQKPGVNSVVINGSEFKSCVLDGDNYLQWVVPGGVILNFDIAYNQFKREDLLGGKVDNKILNQLGKGSWDWCASGKDPFRDGRDIQRGKKKKYVHATFKWGDLTPLL